MSALPSYWQSDEEALSCRGCSQLFTLLRRRHHCRNCGYLYCGVCSPQREEGSFTGQRCCGECWTKMEQDAAYEQRRLMAKRKALRGAGLGGQQGESRGGGGLVSGEVLGEVGQALGALGMRGERLRQHQQAALSPSPGPGVPLSPLQRRSAAAASLLTMLSSLAKAVKPADRVPIIYPHLCLLVSRVLGAPGTRRGVLLADVADLIGKLRRCERRAARAETSAASSQQWVRSLKASLRRAIDSGALVARPGYDKGGDKRLRIQQQQQQQQVHTEGGMVPFEQKRVQEKSGSNKGDDLGTPVALFSLSDEEGEEEEEDDKEEFELSVFGGAGPRTTAPPSPLHSPPKRKGVRGSEDLDTDSTPLAFSFDITVQFEDGPTGFTLLPSQLYRDIE
jgi:hypothetical protein